MLNEICTCHQFGRAEIYACLRFERANFKYVVGSKGRNLCMSSAREGEIYACRRFERAKFVHVVGSGGQNLPLSSVGKGENFENRRFGKRNLSLSLVREGEI